MTVLDLPMHSYSLDTNVRQRVFVVLGVCAFALPSAFANFVDGTKAYFTAMPAVSWPLSFGATFGVLFWLFDRHLWRRMGCLGVPVLEGKWSAQGISSYETDEKSNAPRHQFSLTIAIRQTFTKIEVFTQSDDSTSRSTMASFEIDRACPVFRYAFENTPHNRANAELQRHPGLIELRLEAGNLQGDYFSGKHRLRFGELTATRIS